MAADRSQKLYSIYATPESIRLVTSFPTMICDYFQSLRATSLTIHSNMGTLRATDESGFAG